MVYLHEKKLLVVVFHLLSGWGKHQNYREIRTGTTRKWWWSSADSIPDWIFISIVIVVESYMQIIGGFRTAGRLAEIEKRNRHFSSWSDPHTFIVKTMERKDQLSAHTHSKPLLLRAYEWSMIWLTAPDASISLANDVRISIADELEHQLVEHHRFHPILPVCNLWIRWRSLNNHLRFHRVWTLHKQPR